MKPGVLTRRHSIRRRARRDGVPPTLALQVFARDRGCLAPQLSGTIEAQSCWGKLRIEHVKAEPRLGLRAEPQLNRLATLCEGHTEPGMKAGYVWCTARENRTLLRAYLASLPSSVIEGAAE
jgi:hypothetical protein